MPFRGPAFLNAPLARLTLRGMSSPDIGRFQAPLAGLREPGPSRQAELRALAAWGSPGPGPGGGRHQEPGPRPAAESG